MTRQSQDQVAAAARRRLELLSQELDRAGLRRIDHSDHPDPGADPEADPVDPGLPPGQVIAAPGRHLRPTPRPVGGLVSWVGNRLPDTVRGDTALAPGPVLLVVGLVALAASVTTWGVVRMGGGSETLPDPAAPSVVTASSLPPASQTPVSQTAASRATAAAGPTENVTVDVAGKVRRPGVATLPAGSRVIDALRHAGGARPRVDLSALNLAKVLVDGEQILVGRPRPPGGLAAGASAAAADPGGALVNLNTATATDLETLPGVGPVTAQKILDWRADHGAFSAVDELLEIDGIGEKTFAELAPRVTL